MANEREKSLATAQKYVEKRRYDRAVIEYQKILQEDPNDARILLKLGDLQSKMEAYAEAVATYERVGKQYASLGFSLKAIAVYKQIREIIGKHVPNLDEKYAHVTPQLAELYQQLGLTSDALAALDEVATRFQRQGREQDAIEVFRRIVELDPTNPLSHLRLAEALSHAKAIDEAVAEFGTASGQLLRLGRRDDALKVIERLLQIGPDPSHARIAAELYLARANANDGLQALSKLQICFQANPRDLDTLELLARAFTQIGQAAKAIEVHKEMARIAREGGKQDLFREIVAKLQKLAPNDEGVRELVQGGLEGSPQRPPNSGSRAGTAAPQPPADNADGSYEEVEDVEEGDVESEAEPIELARRPERAASEENVELDASIDLVEAEDEPIVSNAHEQLASVLAEAAQHRRNRQVERAIGVLRQGVLRAPRSLELREMLRDVLVDSGQTRDAVAEMIAIAELLVETLDGDSAARSLQDALGLDPDNDAATRMLHDLGYELVEEDEPATADAPAWREPSGAMRAPLGSFDPEAPLPSYDLEEIGPTDVARRHPSNGMQRAAPPNRIDSMDDPFGDGPLPSFPLESHDAPSDSAYAHLPPSKTSPVPLAVTASIRAPRGIPELEAALEESDFFASRGLFDDARTILNEYLARLPNHPLLRDRIADLNAQEAAAHGDSGTRPAPAASSIHNRAFDIAGALDVTEAGADRPSGVAAANGLHRATEQVDVEEVFAKFKAGVAQQIAIEDTQSHYDLGVAYKEMGLLDDAIREFDLASRDPKNACVCHSMIGMIELERGNLNEAIEALLRGLRVPQRTRDQEAAMSYELAAAYEAKKMAKQALDYFQRTARLLPTFRDVQERIRRLQKADAKPTGRAVAVGADDDFDRAFDDILGDGPRSSS